jgi:hypothetical protein
VISFFKNLKRQRAVIGQRMVTCSNVEPFVKFGFCCGALCFTFELANAVSQSLTGLNKLTVYFYDDLIDGFGCLVAHKFYRPLASGLLPSRRNAYWERGPTRPGENSLQGARTSALPVRTASDFVEDLVFA